MKDLRDPARIGEALLFRRRNADHYVETDGHPRSTACQLADLVFEYDRLPDVPGDVSPIEKYGDPRTFDVEVTTTIRRIPVVATEAMPIDRIALVNLKPKPDGGRLAG